MDPKVLLVSDKLISTEEGEAFHCLVKFKSIWHVGQADALEMYNETAGDGWDLVIIDCETFTEAALIAKEIKEANPEQGLIITSHAFMGIGRDVFGLCVPRKSDAVQIAVAYEIGTSS